VTLLVNEIHVPTGDLRRSFIVLAADRRVTVKGRYDSSRKKLFRIPYLNAGVGYFGLAQVTPKQYFSSRLPNFIRHTHGARCLEDFAHRLRDRLNRDVSKSPLSAYPSGFHVCGYGAAGYPELWFVRNIQDMTGPLYRGFEDAHQSGYDGAGPHVSSGLIQYYVNGDVRSFRGVWIDLQPFVARMLQEPDFKPPRSPDAFAEIAKWKVGVVASFYKQFAKTQTIGAPVDAFALVPEAA
jgi:hypothetical protein